MNCEAIHCPDTDSVRFAIYPDGFDGPRIMARIAGSALRRHFGAAPAEASLIAACQQNFGLIEAQALDRYAAAPQIPVMLSPADFVAAQALAPAA